MQSVDTYSEYKFAKANPLIDHANPFEEGLKRLEIHDIVNAVLLFEAAVQKQADHVDVSRNYEKKKTKINPISGMALSWNNPK